jgi:c-di-GMP-binding flagellar brake protein YcgR
MYEVMDYLKYKDRNLRSIETPTSLDISEGGMRMKTQQNLPVNIYIKIILFLKDSKKPIEIIGHVVWTRLDGKSYESGIQFLEFINNRKAELRSYIQGITGNPAAKAKRKK